MQLGCGPTWNDLHIAVVADGFPAGTKTKVACPACIDWESTMVGAIDKHNIRTSVCLSSLLWKRAPGQEAVKKM